MKLVQILIAILILFTTASAQTLNGNYTIGGNTPDYLTISDAVDTLKTNGVSGAVTFNIRPGVYTENNGADRVFYIDQQISGASSSNLITFQPDAANGGNVDNVILRRSVGSYDEHGWITEIKSDGIILNELTLDYADTSTAGYHPNDSFAAVYLKGSGGPIKNISITGCKIIRTSTVQRMRHGIFLSGSADSIKIENNLISHTFDGIIFGNTQAQKTNILITNNVIKNLNTYRDAVNNQHGDGILIWNGRVSFIIRNNIIDYRNGGYGTAAIEIKSGSGYLIEGNRVINGQSDFWGQRRFDGISVSGGTYVSAKIINNMISTRSPGHPLIIHASNCEIYYNTIVASLSGTSSLEPGTTFFISGAGNQIYNNMFIELRSGSRLHAVLDIADTTGNSINNNCFFKAQQDGKFFKANGVFYDSLSNWQNTGYDLNSIDKLPEFIDRLSDLHLTGCSVYDLELQAALPNTAYPFDLDGELRDPVAPFFGADEASGTLPDIFEPVAITPTGDEALHFTSGDLDGDSDVDIAVLNHPSIGSGDVSLFWNDGDGNFSGPNHIPMGNQPNVLKTVDLDGDGKLDLVATTDHIPVVSWGTGNGNFSSPVDLKDPSPFGAVEDLSFADLDDDGDLDIVQTHLGIVGVDSGYVTQLLNMGNRNFDFASALAPVHRVGMHPSPVTLAHLNNDLLLDAVIVDYVNGIFSSFINQGENAQGVWKGFSKKPEIAVFTGSSPLHANLSTADFDGDQDIDVLIGEWGTTVDSLKLLRNNGDGSFSTPEDFFVDKVRRSKSFTTMDYEGDGDMDIIMATQRNDLILSLNDGFGEFENFLLCQISSYGGEPLTILTDYFNSDSSPDIGVLTITDDFGILLNLNWTPTGLVEPELSFEIEEFRLFQNYPNPFNPTTTIIYEIPKTSSVTLTIFNTLGQEVAELVNEEKQPGVYRVQFDASELGSGVYYYLIQADGFFQTRKMLLIK